MHVEEAIRHRRTICRFLPDPVSATDIREMLAVATMAPSIANRQMWRFVVQTDPLLRKMLVRTVTRRLDEMEQWPEFAGQAQRLRVWRESLAFFTEAPAVLFIVNQGYRMPIDAALVAHGQKSWEVDDQFAHPDVQSISCMLGYLTLLAEERGYGTCWITDLLVARKDLQASLDIPSSERLCAMLLLGKPAEYPPPKGRKAIDELIEWR